MTHAIEQLLQRLAGSHAPCLFEDGAWHSAAELAAAVARWREALSLRMPRRGMVLGLQSPPGLDAVACLLAAWQLRAIVALLPAGAAREQAADHALCELLLSCDAQGRIRSVVRKASRTDPLLEQIRRSDDAGVILFTSGSSGRPRAAVHALSRLLHKYQHGGRPLRTLAVLQMDHLAGLDALLYTLHAGGGFVVSRNRTPEAICQAIEAARVQVLAASPSFLRLLCQSDAARHADLASIAIVTYGSEPMDPATLARVNALFPHSRISQKYGTTELGAPRTASQASDSLWIRLGGEGVQAEVRDGVLWMRSPQQFLGYLGEPAAIDAAGWYCTGDRVECRDGWLRILGRAGELISVGGEKVAPAQVEAAILELPEVTAAAVRGEANVLLGQVVVARVQLRPGAAAAEAERRIRQHCRRRLPPYQVPVRVEVVRDLVGERQKVRRVTADCAAVPASSPPPG